MPMMGITHNLYLKEKYESISFSRITVHFVMMLWRNLVKSTLQKYSNFIANAPYIYLHFGTQTYKNLMPWLILGQVTLETIDIEEDGNEEWFNKFRYEIPVFFFNKKFLCKNRIDMNSFQSALEEFHSEQKKWWQN